MSKKKNIFLIGPMGSGKSSIGRKLAETLTMTFHDSDKTIEERTGVNIAWIFDEEGETGFRERESKVIYELSQLSEIVLATGGGSILNKENRAALATHGFVVYLKTSIDEQVKRTERDQKRPLLQNKATRADVLKDLMQERENLYEDLADYVCNTDKRSVNAVVQEIVNVIKDI